MRRPEMIVFDYGGTLCSEQDWDDLRAERTLLGYAAVNPGGYTAEDVLRTKRESFRDVERIYEELGYDIPVRTTNRIVYGYLGIEFPLKEREMERVLWDSICECIPVRGIAELLAFLKDEGIRAGVLSNNGWSSEAIEDKLGSVLPDGGFEFTFCSSDYLVRKPDTRLFEIALRKAGLPPEAVWYCGDHFEADILGSSSAGLFPVLIDREIDAPRIEEKDGVRFLRIGSHEQLKNYICGLK